MYRRGGNLLEERNWEAAIAEYQKVIDAKGSRADAALYWKAYALNKLGRKPDALAALDELGRSFPSSRWLNDAKALAVEVRQSSGQPVSPEAESDEELKLLAVNALLHSEPDRVVPVLENLLQKGSSPKLKERALFVAAQANTPRAWDLVTKVAKGGGNPDLQLKAVEYLGMTRSKDRDNRPLLAEIYGSTPDVSVKRSVLRAYMMSGDRERLLAAARTEQSADLRREAIRGLGAVNAGDELWQLYQNEKDADIRREILWVAPLKNPDKLLEIARTEKDQRLRREAIHRLGSIRGEQTSSALVSLYSAQPESKKEVMEALMMQNNAKALVEIAKKETDPNLKKAAVRYLSSMKSKEATDYLMELLTK